ncbi:hypothetical protein HOD20_03635 [archaeon]|jgi:hypothetical protein|nr:hypothetical protein [archaeon]MBT4648350.1 hypothetical protein [archaeon]MBT6822339.1 hypothetical protein [archaeon]MBT7391510.1 hypothetical protein [archaeon]
MSKKTIDMYVSHTDLLEKISNDEEVNFDEALFYFVGATSVENLISQYETARNAVAEDKPISGSLY